MVPYVIRKHNMVHAFAFYVQGTGADDVCGLDDKEKRVV